MKTGFVDLPLYGGSALPWLFYSFVIHTLSQWITSFVSDPYKDVIASKIEKPLNFVDSALGNRRDKWKNSPL